MTQPHSPTTILLVRHADVHNPTDIVYGRLPRFGLSKLGREEAARTAAALAATPIQAIYSSPQLRARQTARLIAAPHPGLAVQVSALLAEVKTGWQGTPNHIMAEKNYNFYRDRVNPEDEDVPAVLARMLRWVERMLQRHPGQTVVGVTHGDPAMMMRLFFSGQEVTIDSLRQKDFYPAKGSITHLVFSTTGAVRELHPVVTYEDPSAAEHQALEAAAEAARAASGAPAGPWAATSAEHLLTLPTDEAPMGLSEEETAEEIGADGAHAADRALAAVGGNH
jgi:broad specificity phosphatase PhoE